MIAVGLALTAILAFVLFAFEEGPGLQQASIAKQNQRLTETVTTQITPSLKARAAVLAAAEDVTPDLPRFLQAPLLKASLKALEANGADLSAPMPSNHWIRAESEATAQELIAWAAAHNFSASEPSLFLGHGGTEFFEVALTRIDVPSVSDIQQQGRAIRAGLKQFDNARYTTWVGALTHNQ